MSHPPQDPHWTPQGDPWTPQSGQVDPQLPGFQPASAPPYAAPYPYQQPHPAGYVVPQVTHSVTSSGLPTWMHVVYFFGGVATCGLLWIVWVIHWWFAQSRGTSTTVVQPGYHPPQQAGGQPPQYPQA